MNPRQPEFAGKVFSDKEGKPYEDERHIVEPNDDHPTGMIITQVFYRKGKIHEKLTIIYPDGQEEDWG